MQEQYIKEITVYVRYSYLKNQITTSGLFAVKWRVLKFKNTPVADESGTEEPRKVCNLKTTSNQL